MNVLLAHYSESQMVDMSKHPSIQCLALMKHDQCWFEQAEATTIEPAHECTLEKVEAQQPDCGWEREHLVPIIRGYLKSQKYDQAAHYIRIHIDSFSENRFDMHVRLLKILLHQQRPRKVIRHIKSLPVDYLSEQQQLELRKLAAHAKKQIKEGVLEVE